MCDNNGVGISECEGYVQTLPVGNTFSARDWISLFSDVISCIRQSLTIELVKTERENLSERDILLAAMPLFIER